MIYLDHNATTPVDPEVLNAMLPLLREHFANPASPHPAGQAVARLVDRARRDVAVLAGARPRDVVFTSGATEAANLAIAGVLATAPPNRRRVLVGATEHPAVLAAAQAAVELHGGRVQTVRVHPDGAIDLSHLRALLHPVPPSTAVPSTAVSPSAAGSAADPEGSGGPRGRDQADEVALVAVMAANNETGALNDPRPVAALAHEAGALFLCDVTQAFGRIPVSVTETGIDLAVASAHKMYGPKGTGALIAGRPVRARLTPLIHGGGQERGLRAGTLNTPGIVGFGAAARIAAAMMDDEAIRQRAQTDLLFDLLVGWLGADALEVNGPVEDGSARPGPVRLPNTLNLRFVGADADAVQSCLPDVAVSAGSACHGGGSEPSPVLLAMGRSATAARESLRFSVGRFTTVDQIHAAAATVARAVLRVQSLRAVGSGEVPWPAEPGEPELPAASDRPVAGWTGEVSPTPGRTPELPVPRSALP
ncbi:cysteine desulfurase family protein [Candidatus Frankia alpina]|uniref:cysteine desulfurase n=1 Tax=Candidatus Frankia alpina TaxID=2699483 RepID=A0A4S5ES88_9ACTN|nr:cysteine desulfurase family protein [Candidatus Frankia alpina]THJ75274.1 cysteine desulfurase [Candidatus Frankia alpina]